MPDRQDYSNYLLSARLPQNKSTKYEDFIYRKDIMAGKKIVNKYKIIDDKISIIYITDRMGKTFECIIDTKNLEKVIQYPWHVHFSENTKEYYASTIIYTRDENGEKHAFCKEMHSLISGTSDGEYTDHANSKGLDNREENLVVCSNEENTRRRKSRNSNNKSGYRNVCQIGNKWVVQLQIDGKCTRLKSFSLDLLEEAGAYAEEMRQLYYGKWAGHN